MQLKWFSTNNQAAGTWFFYGARDWFFSTKLNLLVNKLSADFKEILGIFQQSGVPKPPENNNL